MSDNKMLEEDEVINEAKETLERVNFWICHCDEKVGIMLGVFGVIFSILISIDGIRNYKELFEIMWKSFYGKMFSLSIIFSLIAVIVGIFYLIKTLISITDSKIFKEKYMNTCSKIYFDSISKRTSYKDYKCSFTHMRRQDYINDLLSQVFINSKIASKKHNYYKLGTKMSLLGFALFMILSIIAFSIY